MEACTATRRLVLVLAATSCRLHVRDDVCCSYQYVSQRDLEIFTILFSSPNHNFVLTKIISNEYDITSSVHGSGGLPPVSHHGGPKSIPEQSICNATYNDRKKYKFIA